MDIPVEPTPHSHVDRRCLLFHAAQTSGRLMAREDQDGRLLWVCIDLGCVHFDRCESLVEYLGSGNDKPADCASYLSPGRTPTTPGTLPQS